MVISSVDELRPTEERAIVINVNTDMIATLAIVSTLRHANMPTLMVNCHPVSPASRSLFTSLSDAFGFDVVEAPHMPHGRLLDRLFRQSSDHHWLLIDSDAELRSDSIVDRLRTDMNNFNVFGSGWTRGPNWLPGELGGGDHTSYYHERPWMPIVMFRVSAIQKALDAGRTFRAFSEYNDFFFSRRLSRLAAVRLQESFTPAHRLMNQIASRIPPVEKMKNTRWNALSWCRKSYYGQHPNYVYMDTGADIYRYLRYDVGLLFGGPSVELMGNPEDVLITREFAHLHGITRLFTDPKAAAGVKIDLSMLEQLTNRLQSVYGIDWMKLAKSHRLDSLTEERLMKNAQVTPSLIH